MDNIITRIIDLPPGAKGMVMLDENGDYNIYLNARLSIEQQEQAYLHEQAHINLGHFYSDKPIEVKESEAQYVANEK